MFFSESVDFEVETGSIRDCFTKAEQDYISNFLQDVNGGVLYENNTGWDKAIAKTKKMTTALNLRVTAQQPGALARAFAYVAPKYFGTAMHKGAFGIKADSKTVKEMETYSVNAFIKKIGGFDTGTGMSTRQWLDNKEYKGKQKVRAFFDDGQYRDQKLLFAPEMMDRITWVQIWEACKNKIAVEEKLTGEELLVRAGKLFDEVTEKTQVYDSVFSRSGYMRSKNALAKMFTAYMAEPTKTINMLWSAFVNHHGDAKFVAGVTASVITSIILTNLLASVIDAMRHGKDDDNGWELWTGELTADIISDLIPFNYLPIVRDIYSIFSGYDVKRTDLSLVSDFVKATKKFIKANQDGTCTYDDWFTFISAACAMVGLPTKSVWKDIKGIWAMAKIMSNGTSPTYEGFKKALKTGWYDASTIDDILSLPQPSTNKYDTIYQLYVGGNKKEAEKRKKILFKYDKDADQSKLDSYIEGQLLFNKDVIRAASALMKGDMSKTKSEMAKVKNFDKALVLKAMVKMLNEQVDEDAKVTETSLIKGSANKTLEQNLLLNNPTVRKAAIALNKNDDEARYNLQKQLVSEGYSVNDVIKATRTVKGKMFPSEKKDDTSEKEMKYFQYIDVADALKANKAKFARDVLKILESDYAKDGKSAADVHEQVRSKITSTFKQEYYLANETRRIEIRKLMWASGAYDSVDDVTDACDNWVKDIAKKKYSN